LKKYAPRKILILVFLLFAFTNAFASQKPKFIVGIVVDQMTNDYLTRFYKKFSEKGFKRFLNGGFYFKNSTYEYVPTLTAPGHTCIYTGSVPSLTGIIANEWYDRENNKIVYCADDKSVTAVGTHTNKEKYSPKNLKASTITDEFLKANPNSRVISISGKNRGAVFAGGHLGKSFWYDDVSGNFITSTYYMNELPEWLKKFNERKLTEQYLSGQWNTLYPIETYTESTEDNVPWESLFKGIKQPVFPYDLPSLREKNKELIEYTPYGNEILKEAVLSCLEDEKLGKSNTQDFLCVSFSSTDRVGHHFGPNSIEIEDVYLRLDKDLEEIFNYIEKNIGFENIIMFLSSDHGVVSAAGYLNSIGVEAGNIKTKELQDSLEIHLAKKYGENDWVIWIQNLQVYLNHKEIKNKNISLEEIQNDAAEYLRTYTSMKEVYTSEGIDKGIYDTKNSKLIKSGYIKEISGDVFMVLDSNHVWNMSTGTTHGTVYKYDRNVPLLWYGAGIKHGESDEYNSQCDIAVTLADILNIPKPDKSIGKSLKRKIVK
jgi:predicted AlkP superfamily pyrophosphatase or phosphodiesterase